MRCTCWIDEEKYLLYASWMGMMAFNCWVFKIMVGKVLLALK
jgi:hypothetical protein